MKAPAIGSATAPPEDDPRAVTILGFEKWLSEAPQLRCLVGPADALKLRPGTRVTIALTLGKVPRLDGGTFVVEVVRPDGFSINFPLDDARAVFGVQGRASFDPSAPIVTPKTGAPIKDFVQVWVYKHNVVLAGGYTGFLFVPKADALKMIADGDAVDAYFEGELPYIGSSGPRAPDPAARATTAQPEPLTALIDGFEQGINPVCHSLDTDKLRSGDLVRLHQTAGVALFAQVNGQSAIVHRTSSHFYFQLFGVSTRGLDTEILAARAEVLAQRNVHLYAFTATNPAECQSRDAALLYEGEEIFIDQQLSGPDVPQLKNAVGRVRSLTPTGFLFEGLDLTGVPDLSAVTAQGYTGRPQFLNFILLTPAAPTVATVLGMQGATVKPGDTLLLFQYAGAPLPQFPNTGAWATVGVNDLGYELELIGIDLTGADTTGVRVYGMVTSRPNGRP